MGKHKKLSLFLILFVSIFLPLTLQPTFAAQVTISDVPGYGFNSGAWPFVGCGPTSGVMILDTYDNRLSGAEGAPGDLVSDPLTVAWDLHNNYMGTNNDGFGSPSDMHYGMENYAEDQGYILDAVIHVESTTYNPADWPYAEGDDLVADANFWDTMTWDINDLDFLNFVKPEIDAGAPIMVTVDSDGDASDDHWMILAGYDLDARQWGGYNTWDSSLHWYDVESAFIAGNTMGVAYVRTFDYLGPINGEVPVPEPTTILLLGSGVIGLAWFRRKFR
jgi:hypothetical protein